MSERRNRIAPADSLEFLRLLASLPIRVYPSGSGVEDMSALYDIAAQYSLTAYDAAYLRLATTLNRPLATKDGDLLAAAEAADVTIYR